MTERTTDAIRWLFEFSTILNFESANGGYGTGKDKAMAKKNEINSIADWVEASALPTETPDDRTDAFRAYMEWLISQEMADMQGHADSQVAKP